ncbi:MAG: preprotein translocase subunit SecE [Coriobacteriia bacterium]|nr:preprotein translocase subunit SecE [Coriobacteriia bacterium]
MAKTTKTDGTNTKDGAKTKPSNKGNKGKQAKPNVFARLAQYFRDVRSEMRRVVWPTRKDVLNSSIVVIVALLFFSLFALLVDTAVVKLFELLWNRIGS